MLLFFAMLSSLLKITFECREFYQKFLFHTIFSGTISPILLYSLSEANQRSPVSSSILQMKLEIEFWLFLLPDVVCSDFDITCSCSWMFHGSILLIND